MLLSKLFLRIMAANTIPRMWRKAKVIAIEKSGKTPKTTVNSRPIPLLSVYLKLVRCSTLGCIAETVGETLSLDQVGFRESRSTCDQAAALTTYIEQGFQY